MASQSLRTASIFAKGFGQRSSRPAWNGAWRRLFTSSTHGELGAVALRCARPAYGSAFRAPRITTPNAILGSSRRGFRFSAWRRNGNAGQAAEKPLSLSEKLKRMTRDYGWTAVGVYFALSVLDFPFCFLLVKIVGVETIGKAEHYVVSGLKAVIPAGVFEWFQGMWSYVKKTEKKELGDNGEITQKVEMAGWGVEKAQAKHSEEASIWTQLALAYAIHKSFIFLRIPLTAAILPKVVKVLRGWGYKIGKRAAV